MLVSYWFYIGPYSNHKLKQFVKTCICLHVLPCLTTGPQNTFVSFLPFFLFLCQAELLGHHICQSPLGYHIWCSFFFIFVFLLITAMGIYIIVVYMYGVYVIFWCRRRRCNDKIRVIGLSITLSIYHFFVLRTF